VGTLKELLAGYHEQEQTITDLRCDLRRAERKNTTQRYRIASLENALLKYEKPKRKRGK
jgi:hypothetical protein